MLLSSDKSVVKAYISCDFGHVYSSLVYCEASFEIGMIVDKQLPLIDRTNEMAM